jgi:hypothetical protein
MNLFQYVGNSPLNWIDPFGFKRNKYKDKDKEKGEAEHTKNKRSSTLNKHQEGQSRKKRDKFLGEAGDWRRYEFGSKAGKSQLGKKIPVIGLLAGMGLGLAAGESLADVTDPLEPIIGINNVGEGSEIGDLADEDGNGIPDQFDRPESDVCSE